MDIGKLLFTFLIILVVYTFIYFIVRNVVKKKSFNKTINWILLVLCIASLVSSYIVYLISTP
ncbi:hypothetical protein [Paenibacillus xylanexedens]|uniref:hypothetical protein n=1 Tax=Paenibacillus xylanexedens TaxID=528191 RepID=UPI0037CA51D0